MICHVCKKDVPEYKTSCYTDIDRSYDHVMICNDCLLLHAEKYYPGAHVHRLVYLSVNGIQFEPIKE